MPCVNNEEAIYLAKPCLSIENYSAKISKLKKVNFYNRIDKNDNFATS